MQKPSHSHEHEFLAECEDDVTTEFDGRYVYVNIQCIHAPILKSVADYERDEMYDVHGDRCEAVQKTNATVSDPVGVDTGVAVTYDDNYDMWNAIMDELADDIKETAATSLAGYNADGEASVVTTEWISEQYRVDLEVEDREIVQ